VIVQFRVLPDEDQRLKLGACGVRLLDYLPENSFFASVPSQTQAARLHEVGIAWLGPIHPEDKLPPRIVTSGIGSWALLDAQTAKLCVRHFADVSADFVARALADLGATVVRVDTLLCKFTLLLPVTRLWDLAAADWVRWIEEVPPPPISFNDGSRANAHADAVQEAPYNLSGAGVVAGMWDSGKVDPNHSDFSGRLTIADTNLPVSVHTTHVAGTLAGNGNQSQAHGGTARQWRGVAPAASIVCYSYDDPVPQHESAINDYGISISHNSWGRVISPFFGSCGLFGDYNNTAPDFDQIVTGLYGRPISVVFAAGNLREGLNTNSCGVGPYGTVGPPATAKNVITVGAIDSADNSMPSFSGWGPLEDGRLKPDLVAPGAQVTEDGGVTSTIPGNSYGVSRGTSMAAPVVSGAVALLIEDYRARYNGQDPLPSTVKALLLHTAADLDDDTPYYNKGPDFASGYGRVQIKEAVDQLRGNGVLVGRVGHGQTNTHILTVPEGTRQVKVTLVWDDAAGTENATIALVNDLDLIVLDSEKRRFFPWTFDLTDPSLGALRVQEDHLNVVEQVLVDTGVSPGVWTVQVVGHAVPVNSPQKYSLAFTPTTVPLQPLLTIDHASFNDGLDLEANGDGVIDPGEIILANVVLRNTDGPAATNVVATLTCATPGVTMVQGTAFYPVMLPGALATNLTPFAIRIAKSLACGTVLSFTQAALANGVPLDNSFTFKVGSYGLTNRSAFRFASAGAPTPIPDGGSLDSALLPIPIQGQLVDVDVSVRINHPWTGDIQIELLHPDGTPVRLKSATADRGQDFGVGGCEASEAHTIFDDQASSSIATATAPFVGRFAPESPLSALNGKGLAGEWRLRVTDVSAEDAGTLLCWGLTATAEQYGDSCHVFNRPPTALSQNLTVIHGAPTAINLSGSDRDNEPLTFEIASLPSHGALSGFDPGTGRLTYTPEAGYSGPDSFSFSANDGTTNSGPATVSLMVREPAADLAIAVTAPAELVAVDSEVTYELVISNRGPNTATGVAVVMPVPEGMEFVSAASDSGQCSFALGAVSCNLMDLDVGTSATVRVVVKPVAVGSFVSTPSVSAHEIDDNPADNQATTRVTAKLDADLALLQVAGLEPAFFGVVFRYEFLVTNQGPNVATSTRLVDSLPQGIQLLSVETSQGTWTNRPDKLICELGDLAAGGTASVAVLVTPSTLSILTNQAVVTADQIDLHLADNTATVVTTVLPHAELVISQSTPAEPAVPGHDLRYVITISQQGPNLATGVRVIDTLPVGVSFISAATSQGTFTERNGILTWDLDRLPSGSWAALTFVVRPSQPGLITNAAVVVAREADLNPGDNTTTTTTEVKELADVAVTSSAAPSPVLVGDNLEYSLLITNRGPSASPNLWLTNFLADTLTLVAVESTRGTCTNLDGMVVGELGKLSPGDYAVVTVVVTPTQPGPLTNVTIIADQETDPDPSNNTVTNITHARFAADVALAVLTSADVVSMGDNLTYSITVANNGPSTANGVCIQDALPTGVDFFSAEVSQGTVLNENGVVRFDVGELLAGASASATLVVTPLETSVVTNTITVRADEIDQVPDNNTVSVATRVVRIADLAITWTEAPATGLIGSPIILSVIVTNLGPHAARGVVVTDELPAELGLVSAEASQGACHALDHTVTCELGELPSGASASITLNLLPLDLGPATNSVSVTSTELDPNPADNVASRIVTIQPSANLAVATAATPDPAALGHELVYLTTVTNLGPGTATSLVLNQMLSDSLTVVSIDSTLANCTNLNGRITCQIAELPAGSNALVRVVGIPAQIGAVTNLATVSAIETDLVPDNNSFLAITPVRLDADLAVALSVTPDPVLAGRQFTCTVIVTNLGPNPATSVALTNLLPAGIDLLAAESSRGTCSRNGDLVTCAVGDLAVGEGVILTLVAVPLGQGTITNHVSVRSGEADLHPENNAATASLVVRNIADLSLSVIEPPTLAILGFPLTYSLAVTNSGPHPATQILLTDLLPDGTTFVSVDSGQGTISAEGNTWRLELGRLDPGETVTASFTVIPDVAATITNAASVSASEFDPDLAGNSVETTTVIIRQANLVLSLTGSPDPVALGSDLIYALTVTNLGPHAATGVLVTDPLPPTVELISAEPTQGSVSVENGVVRCIAGELPVAGSLSMKIIVRPLAQGIVTNTATVSANEFDPNLADNSAGVVSAAKLDAELSLTKTVSPSLVLVRQVLVSRVVVTNHGPHPATLVKLTEQLPESVNLVSVESSQGTFLTLGKMVLCELGTLEVGAKATLSVTVVPTLTGLITNAATVTADEIDPDPANNVAVTIVRVQPLADLLVTQTAVPDPVLVDNSLHLTITVANRAPYVVPNVTLTDLLPDENVEFVSAQVSQGRVARTGRVLMCTLGELAQDSVATMDVIVIPHALGRISNQATVSSPAADPTNPNLTSVAKVTVVETPTIRLEWVGNRLVISWPSTASQFFLESTETVADPNSWTFVSEAVLEGDRLTVTIKPTGTARFYRIKKP
jgi:uncharacterized repeat protein (TIGR01451 family)